MKKIIILLMGVFALHNSYAQVSETSELFITLKKQDSIFFEKGFNQCDIPYLEKTMADDMKFYHDQSGLQNKKIFFENTKKYICGNPNKKPIRKLVEGSLEVYPLYKDSVLYGAIQNGVHDFYIRETGKADVKTGTAKFTTVWTLKNNEWIFSDCLSYDHGESSKTGITTSFEKDINALLKASKVPALGIGIIKNGKLSEVKVYGELKAGIPAPYNAIFKVASLAKPITALVALKLVDSGKLQLDEKLSKYWVDPDLKDDKWLDKLTVRNILTHQTGFPNWRYMTDSKKLTFEFEPGTKHQYSGEGFEYLRKALEKKFGKSLEQLAAELVFKPASMTDTRFWWDKTMDATRYAENHDENGKMFDTYKYYEANAAANLLTTVEDYGNFIAYVINGAGLSEGLYKQMISPQLKLKDKDYFGLGWEILTDFSTGDNAVIHTGKDAGVNTLAIMFPKSKNGYVIFLNGDNFEKIYETILEQYLFLGKELWERK